MSKSNPTTTDPRREKGQRIADRFRIRREGAVSIIPSESSDAKYRVDLEAGTCTCPDFETRHIHCKHQFAVEFSITCETDGKGTETVTKTVRMTYSQEWSAYNAAQTHEHERFLPLLRELCDGIEQPTQIFGRPRLPLSDVLFALGVKTYSTMSGRRAISQFRSAEAQGMLDCAPSFTSSFRYLESPELTPQLKQLIEESAKPLRAVEIDFAVDSTGIGTTSYRRWFDHKWGRERSTQTWVKLHIVTGVKTNIVTAVEATATESADAPQLPRLIDRTAESFAVQEVSADKAYSSRRNLRAIQNVGANPYIPFKHGTNGVGKTYDGLWSRTWHYYMFNREAFLEHYHKRSNAETTMHMIKAKFGASVRAKTPVAQVNEALLKVLAHNICVLIQSIYELGLEPVFWTSGTERASVPKIGNLRLF